MPGHSYSPVISAVVTLRTKWCLTFVQRLVKYTVEFRNQRMRYQISFLMSQKRMRKKKTATENILGASRQKSNLVDEFQFVVFSANRL